MKNLKRRGYDAAVLENRDRPDILVTLSLDHGKWSEFCMDCKVAGSVLILDLAENEFERSAKLTKKKFRSFFNPEKLYPGNMWSRVPGFFRRSRFDKGFYQLVETSTAITASSNVILKDALKFNENSFFIPDSMDLSIYTQKKTHTKVERPTIGWIGMPNSLGYLLQINGPLQYLQKEYGARVVLISDWKCSMPFMKAVDRFMFEYEPINWDLATVESDLLEMDIAVTPLPPESYKSFNKVLTFWAACQPVVASPTEEYKSVIEHGLNGFLASTYDDWVKCLEELIFDEKLRGRMGEEGYRKASSTFNLDSVAERYIEIFEELTAK